MVLVGTESVSSSADKLVKLGKVTGPQRAGGRSARRAAGVGTGAEAERVQGPSDKLSASRCVSGRPRYVPAQVSSCNVWETNQLGLVDCKFHACSNKQIHMAHTPPVEQYTVSQPLESSTSIDNIRQDAATAASALRQKQRPMGNRKLPGSARTKYVKVGPEYYQHENKVPADRITPVVSMPSKSSRHQHSRTTKKGVRLPKQKRPSIGSAVRHKRGQAQRCATHLQGAQKVSAYTSDRTSFDYLPGYFDFPLQWGLTQGMPSVFGAEPTKNNELGNEYEMYMATIGSSNMLSNTTQYYGGEQQSNQQYEGPFYQPHTVAFPYGAYTHTAQFHGHELTPVNTQSPLEWSSPLSQINSPQLTSPPFWYHPPLNFEQYQHNLTTSAMFMGSPSTEISNVSAPSFPMGKDGSPSNSITSSVCPAYLNYSNDMNYWPYPRAENYNEVFTAQSQATKKQAQISLITHQLVYYFSASNLCKDLYLRSLITPATGAIKITDLMKFQRIQNLTNGGSDIKAVIQAFRSPELSHVEVLEAEECIIIKNWRYWVYDKSS